MSLSALRAMDQYSQYLMWMKTQNQDILNFHFQATMNQFNNSWEEKAFADDSAGPLGGFVWPPRSYTCSFCKREFRSAQALGGHMNVHRRDRARLKQQSLTPQNEVVVHHQTCKSLDIASYPSQVCFTDSSNIDPNNNANPIFLASSPHDSPSSRVSVSLSLSLSAMSTQENFSEHAYVSPPFSSSIVPQEDHVGQLLNDSDSKTGFGKIGRKEDFTFLGHDDCVETNLILGLNLVVSQNQPSGFDGDHEVITWKRHKTSGSLEDLDLELRLGDPPKVK